jgi:murein DD-endopeptidase MepM/ murein hydrolase activator NlpD
MVTCGIAATLLMLAGGSSGALGVAQAPRVVRPGDVVLLTISRARAPVDAGAFGRTWPGFSGPDGWRVLVGIDLATKPGPYDVTIRSGGDVVVHRLVVRARSFPVRRLTVDPALVDPPPEARERIDSESRELAAVFSASPAQRSWTAGFVRPVPDRANSAFGTHSVFNGRPRSQHTGADFLSPAGCPVKAPNAGRVVVADSRYFSGNTVIIDHGQGLFSMLAHLSAIAVAVGADVAPGDVVGRVGATGRVTGPHLHWTVRLNGVNVDPLSLLAVLGEKRRTAAPPAREPAARSARMVKLTIGPSTLVSTFR